MNTPTNPTSYSPSEKRFLCETARQIFMAALAGSSPDGEPDIRYCANSAEEILAELKGRGWFVEGEAMWKCSTCGAMMGNQIFRCTNCDDERKPIGEIIKSNVE